MADNANRQAVTINQLVSHQSQVVTIEGDLIVPDVKPDILNAIDTEGNVCIYKKEVQDGKVKFDGCIYLNMIYLANADQGMVRGLTNSLDFSQSIQVDACRSGMALRNSFTIQAIECKVLNERKVNIKVTMNVELWIYSNEEIQILKEVNNIEGIQTLHTSMQINHLIGRGNCRASAKDTIHIEGGESLAEILKTEIKLSNQEIKVSYNKILLKADANVKIMYLTEEGSIKTIKNSIPVMGFVDMNNVSEDNLFDCDYEIKNILVKPNIGQSSSITVEIEFEISCEASDSKNIELIQDMYSPLEEIVFEPKEVTTIMNKQMEKKNCCITERMSIPEIDSHQIYDVEVNPILEKTNILNGKIVYEGNLKLNFVYSTNDSAGIATQAYILPFTFTVENEKLNSEKVISTRIFPIDDNFTVVGEGLVDCNINLMFMIETYNHVTIHIIDEISVRENQAKDYPSMIIYIAKEGDSLWEIAKKYKTTMEDIIQTNQLRNPNTLEIGQKIFIQRFSVNRIA